MKKLLALSFLTIALAFTEAKAQTPSPTYNYVRSWVRSQGSIHFWWSWSGGLYWRFESMYTVRVEDKGNGCYLFTNGVTLETMLDCGPATLQPTL